LRSLFAQYFMTSSGFARLVSRRLLLCATSVFSVSLWLFFLSNSKPQRHREHRDCTEKISLYSKHCAPPERNLTLCGFMSFKSREIIDA
jgi:hypothetical protein